MKNLIRYSFFVAVFGLSAVMIVSTRQALANGLAGGGTTAAPPTGAQSADDLAPGSAQLINPEDLLNILQSPKGQKPLILNIGPHLLYMQAHIPGSEYIGAGSESQGIESLRRRVKPLPHNKFNRSLLRMLPLEPLSQRAACVQRAAQSGLHQRESALHCRQLWD